MVSLMFEIGEHEYELFSDYCLSPVLPTFSDPGDGGEVEIDTTVIVYTDGAKSHVTDYAAFVALLSGERGWTVERTMAYLEERFHERWADDRRNDLEDYYSDRSEAAVWE